jgi:diguanylate cyclase (GGDEF)-like protein
MSDAYNMRALRLVGGTATEDEDRLAGELDRIVVSLSAMAGVETALVVISGAGGTFDVLSAAGTVGPVVARPPDFAARAVSCPTATLDTIDPDHDFSLGLASSGATLGYAVSGSLHLGHGPAGALCAGLAWSRAAPEEELLWTIETYARLASLTLRQDPVLLGLPATGFREDPFGSVTYAALLQELGREIERSRRQKLSLSCCFVSLDHHLNDRFGRAHGNLLLLKLGRLLRTTVRTVDTVGRYGGNEFVIVMPGTTAVAAVALAERLLTVIKSLPVPGVPDGLDASVGIAEWRPGAGPNQLLGDADQGLAAAKAGGGAQVAICPRDEDAARVD